MKTYILAILLIPSVVLAGSSNWQQEFDDAKSKAECKEVEDSNMWDCIGMYPDARKMNSCKQDLIRLNKECEARIEEEKESGIAIADVSNHKHAFFVSCGSKVHVTPYVWIINDNYYCGGSSAGPVPRCQAYPDGMVEWKLNSDEIEYVDGWRQKSGVLRISLNVGEDEDLTKVKSGTYTQLSLYSETVHYRNLPDSNFQHKKESSGNCTVHRNRVR